MHQRKFVRLHSGVFGRDKRLCTLGSRPGTDQQRVLAGILFNGNSQQIFRWKRTRIFTNVYWKYTCGGNLAL